MGLWGSCRANQTFHASQARTHAMGGCWPAGRKSTTILRPFRSRFCFAPGFAAIQHHPDEGVPPTPLLSSLSQGGKTTRQIKNKGWDISSWRLDCSMKYFKKLEEFIEAEISIVGRGIRVYLDSWSLYVPLLKNILSKYSDSNFLSVASNVKWCCCFKSVVSCLRTIEVCHLKIQFQIRRYFSLPKK